jgi:hypothetical protein
MSRFEFVSPSTKRKWRPSRGDTALTALSSQFQEPSADLDSLLAEMGHGGLPSVRCSGLRGTPAIADRRGR